MAVDVMSLNRLKDDPFIRGHADIPKDIMELYPTNPIIRQSVDAAVGCGARIDAFLTITALMLAKVNADLTDQCINLTMNTVQPLIVTGGLNG